MSFDLSPQRRPRTALCYTRHCNTQGTRFSSKSRLSLLRPRSTVNSVLSARLSAVCHRPTPFGLPNIIQQSANIGQRNPASANIGQRNSASANIGQLFSTCVTFVIYSVAMMNTPYKTYVVEIDFVFSNYLHIIMGECAGVTLRV